VTLDHLADVRRQDVVRLPEPIARVELLLGASWIPDVPSATRSTSVSASIEFCRDSRSSHSCSSGEMVVVVALVSDADGDVSSSPHAVNMAAAANVTAAIQLVVLIDMTPPRSKLAAPSHEGAGGIAHEG